MTKDISKILPCEYREYRKIFKVCLAIFQHVERKMYKSIVYVDFEIMK